MRDDNITAASAASVQGELACADAHGIATELSVSPMEVGKAVNRATQLRFNRCQLGLFGYGVKAQGYHIIALPAARVPDEIEAAIKTKVVNDRISCLDAWEIAESFKYPRLGIANILELMGLKVKPCQLGCF